MKKLIECGECTVQKLGRISIAGVMKKNNIEPGDTVIVDLRMPIGEDVDEDIAKELNSTKYHIMSTLSSIELAADCLEDCLTGELTGKSKDDTIISTGKLLKSLQESLKVHFDIGDKEYKKFQKYH